MLIRVLIGVVIAAALVLALRWSQSRSGPEVVSGTLEVDDVRLGSRVGGRVQRVHVEEGDHVAAGQVLVELEPYDLLEQKAEAAAALQAANAELARLQAGFRPQEIAQAAARRDRSAAHLEALKNGPRPAEIEVARARVRLAEAELDLRKLEHERAQTLRESDIQSAGELDRATFQLRAAQAGLEQRQHELQLLEEGTRAEEIAEAEAELHEMQAALDLAQKGYRDEEIRRAEAEAAAAAARLASIERSIEELAIRAPIAGVVEAIALEPGDLVAPNAPVLSLLEQGRLWVRAYIPATRLDLELGQELELDLDAFPGETFRGRVVYLARDAEFIPGNVQTPEERSRQVFRVKIALDDPQGRLRAGMTASVRLPER